jgi:hypothetical protein
MMRFSLKKLTDIEVKEQYQLKISTDLDNKVDMNRENIKQSLVHYELKQHKYKN